MVQTFLEIVGIYVAVYGASLFCDHLSMNKIMNLKDPVAFALIFTFVWAATYVVFEIALTIVQKIIKITVMGQLDSIGGMIVGGFKAILILAIFLRLLNIMPLAQPWKEWVDRSVVRLYSLPVLEQSYLWLYHQLPKQQMLFKNLPANPTFGLPATPSGEAAAQAIKDLPNAIKNLPDQIHIPMLITTEGRVR